MRATVDQNDEQLFARLNQRAVASALVVKRHRADDRNQISLEVGELVSVLSMKCGHRLWSGKKVSVHLKTRQLLAEVGLFPAECVQVIANRFKLNELLSQQRLLSPPNSKFGAFFRSLTRRRQRKVFGTDLCEHVQLCDRDIPFVLKSCSAFLETHGVVDGIYRLSGVTSNIQKLRAAFDDQREPDFADARADIHCVSSLLKMYFRELPDPLLTFRLYDRFVSAAKRVDDADDALAARLARLRSVVGELRDYKPAHYRSLECLMRHLSRISSHHVVTGMTAKNLAIVWSPNLLRASPSSELTPSVEALHVIGTQAVLTEHLIAYCSVIFDASPTPPTADGSRDACLESAHSYIDVGFGPNFLPKFHTILELNNRRTKRLPWKPKLFKNFSNESKFRRRLSVKSINTLSEEVVRNSERLLCVSLKKSKSLDSFFQNKNKTQENKRKSFLILFAANNRSDKQDSICVKVEVHHNDSDASDATAADDLQSREYEEQFYSLTFNDFFSSNESSEETETLCESTAKQEVCAAVEQHACAQTVFPQTFETVLSFRTSEQMSFHLTTTTVTTTRECLRVSAVHCGQQCVRRIERTDNSVGDERLKRERIDKYKHERRQQLRELLTRKPVPLPRRLPPSLPTPPTPAHSNAYGHVTHRVDTRWTPASVGCPAAAPLPARRASLEPRITSVRPLFRVSRARHAVSAHHSAQSQSK